MFWGNEQKEKTAVAPNADVGYYGAAVSRFVRAATVTGKHLTQQATQAAQTLIQKRPTIAQQAYEAIEQATSESPWPPAKPKKSISTHPRSKTKKAKRRHVKIEEKTPKRSKPQTFNEISSPAFKLKALFVARNLEEYNPLAIADKETYLKCLTTPMREDLASTLRAYARVLVKKKYGCIRMMQTQLDDLKQLEQKTPDEAQNIENHAQAINRVFSKIEDYYPQYYEANQLEQASKELEVSRNNNNWFKKEIKELQRKIAFITRWKNSPIHNTSEEGCSTCKKCLIEQNKRLITLYTTYITLRGEGLAPLKDAITTAIAANQNQQRLLHAEIKAKTAYPTLMQALMAHHKAKEEEKQRILEEQQKRIEKKLAHDQKFKEVTNTDRQSKAAKKRKAAAKRQKRKLKTSKAKRLETLQHAEDKTKVLHPEVMKELLDEIAPVEATRTLASPMVPYDPTTDSDNSQASPISASAPSTFREKVPTSQLSTPEDGTLKKAPPTNVMKGLLEKIAPVEATRTLAHRMHTDDHTTDDDSTTESENSQSLLSSASSTPSTSRSSVPTSQLSTPKNGRLKEEAIPIDNRVPKLASVALMICTTSIGAAIGFHFGNIIGLAIGAGIGFVVGVVIALARHAHSSNTVTPPEPEKLSTTNELQPSV